MLIYFINLLKKYTDFKKKKYIDLTFEKSSLEFENLGRNSLIKIFSKVNWYKKF